MIINVFDEQQALKISPDQVRQLVQQVIDKEGESCDEVNIYFVDRSLISMLHEEFFEDPSPTDCISFPIDEKGEEESGYRILGEIFVCPSTAISYAAQHEGDAYLETTLYLVHGLLHLMNYRDIEEEDVPFMREKEAYHLQHLQESYLQLRPPLDPL